MRRVHTALAALAAPDIDAAVIAQAAKVLYRTTVGDQY
jgi:hypothetical protein